MPFIDWDPIVRASVFGAAFLVPLLAVLWVWYDTSGRTDGARWYWRLIVSVLVLLTTPAVVLAAANLDVKAQDMMRIFGWLAIGSGGVALLGVLAYAIWGRATLTEAEDVEFEPFVFPDSELPAVEAATLPPVEAATLPAPATVVASPTVTIGAGAGAPGRGQAAAGGYMFVKSGPDQGRQFPLGVQVTLGRAPNCGIVLADPRVSAEHAQIKREGNTYAYLDLKSTNGSYLIVEGREVRLRSSQALVDGDEIRVGQTVLQFLRTAAKPKR